MAESISVKFPFICNSLYSVNKRRQASSSTNNWIGGGFSQLRKAEVFSCIPHRQLIGGGHLRKPEVRVIHHRHVIGGHRVGVRAFKEDENVGSNSPSLASRVTDALVNTFIAAAFCFSSLWGVDLATARPERVDRPDLLPSDYTPLIDVAGFLSPQQEFRIIKELNSLEDETGYKLRVIAQNYPNTPGLAVKNFWKVDDQTVVLVADPNMDSSFMGRQRIALHKENYATMLLGNILNFNVGAGVDLNVPRNFWSRVAGKYGTMFIWKEEGEDVSIEAAVKAIATCLREPAGPRTCSSIK